MFECNLTSFSYASSSGLNFARENFMFQRPTIKSVCAHTIKVLQPTEMGDLIQATYGEGSLIHVNFQTVAAHCLGQH